MANGGARPGSGRKPGKPGSKGSIAKELEKRKAIATAEEIFKGKQTPLEFFAEIMHNHEEKTDLRLAAASKAADYVHRKQPTDVILQAEVRIDGIDIAIMGKE